MIFHVLLYRRLSILQGIYFLIRVYEYTKIGENYIISKKPERDQLHASPQSLPRINGLR